MEWVEPNGGVVCFPRIRPGVPVDVDKFYRVLTEVLGTYVGPGPLVRAGPAPHAARLRVARCRRSWRAASPRSPHRSARRSRSDVMSLSRRQVRGTRRTSSWGPACACICRRGCRPGRTRAAGGAGRRDRRRPRVRRPRRPSHLVRRGDGGARLRGARLTTCAGTASRPACAGRSGDSTSTSTTRRSTSTRCAAGSRAGRCSCSATASAASSAPASRRSAPDVRGLILSSPFFALTVQPEPLKRFGAKVLSVVWPGRDIGNTVRAEELSHDEVVVEAYVTDPLVHHVARRDGRPRPWRRRTPSWQARRASRCRCWCCTARRTGGRARVRRGGLRHGRVRGQEARARTKASTTSSSTRWGASGSSRDLAAWLAERLPAAPEDDGPV